MNAITPFLDSDICSDCKRWENLPLHNVSFYIDNSNDAESSLLEESFLRFHLIMKHGRYLTIKACILDI